MVTANERGKLAASPPMSRDDRSLARPNVQAALELVADYIRASGIRDPNQIAALANRCVREARKAEDGAGPALGDVALRLASAHLGLACAPLPPPEHVSAVVPGLRPEDVVPTSRPRVMPEQKLDELLPIAEPGTWRKIVRAGTAGIALLMAKVRLV